VQVRLLCDLGVGVPAVLEVPDLAEHLDTGLPTAGQVLREAHQHEILARGVDDERRDRGVSELAARLEPALSTHQFVERLAVLESLAAPR
jgi:hypothetical protein